VPNDHVLLQLLELPELTAQAQVAIFAAGDGAALFLVAEARTWHTYAYSPNTTKGAVVKHVSCMEAVKGSVPLILTHEGLTVQLDSGHIMTHAVDTFPRAAKHLDGMSSKERHQQVKCALGHTAVPSACAIQCFCLGPNRLREVSQSHRPVRP
jgi:hypothetical protein